MVAPLISVIIPVFNGERFLQEAVASVLAQQYSPLEIIIVDDGSTDGTRDVVRSLPKEVRYLHQANSGPATARNLGIEQAHGSLIAFEDADDLWPTGKLKLQLPYLIDDPAAEIVMGRIQEVHLSKTIDGQPEAEVLAEPVFSVNLGAAIFRKSVFERVGMFDETMRYSEDVDWFMRARESGAAIIKVDAVTLFYRKHEENMTRGRNIYDLNILKTLKKSLDRRRGITDIAAELPALPMPASTMQSMTRDEVIESIPDSDPEPSQTDEQPTRI